MCACVNNHRSTCALLLVHHADLCALNDRGQNVLHLAAFLGSISLTNEFLHGSNPDHSIVVKAVNQGDHRNQTPLFYACLEGHIDVAFNLIQSGGNLYHLDQENQTCLHAMLCSSVIFKRHLRLFFSFIQLVDFRFMQDHLNRTLLDLAYLNQLNSIIELLSLLNYQRNYSIISNHQFVGSTHVLSLRQICILNFKRSIVYHRSVRQGSQRELLEQALQQTFHLELPRSIDVNEISYRQSLDDISTLSKKSLKKSRKLPKELDASSVPTSWSIFTNKFKTNRTSSNPTDNTSSLEKKSHPMKHLLLMIFLSPNKLDKLLDFPSRQNNHLLEEDLKMIMSAYHLQHADVSNQI